VFEVHGSTGSHLLLDRYPTILKDKRVKLDYLNSQRLWRILIFGSCHINTGTACILRYVVIEICCYVGFFININFRLIAGAGSCAWSTEKIPKAGTYQYTYDKYNNGVNDR
jgi:hypothetical protein